MDSEPFAKACGGSQDLWFGTGKTRSLVIFLHGMYSTPATFEDYAARWVKTHPQWDVFIPALPAGAKDIETLKALGPSPWSDSLAAAELKVRAAAKGRKTVVLGGHSQGGALTLALAPKLDFIKALIVIAAPLRLGGSNLSWDDNLGIALSGLLCLLMPGGIAKPVPYTKERLALEKPCDAEGLIYPLTIHTMKQGLSAMEAGLPSIKAPVFMSYCKQDRLVDYSNAGLLAKSLGSSLIIRKDFDVPKEKEPYGRKHQLLNYTLTREELSEALDRFLEALDNADI